MTVLLMFSRSIINETRSVIDKFRSVIDDCRVMLQLVTLFTVITFL